VFDKLIYRPDFSCDDMAMFGALMRYIYMAFTAEEDDEKQEYLDEVRKQKKWLKQFMQSRRISSDIKEDLQKVYNLAEEALRK